MSLIDTIHALDTNPYDDGEEYTHTSDFLEWFYKNIVRKEDDLSNVVLNQIVKEPEYKMMRQLCLYLINKDTAQHFDIDTRYRLYEDIKKWLVSQFEDKMNVAE